MASISDNLKIYSNPAIWSEHERLWSGVACGSASNQWYGAIRPRIAEFLPAETVLEIASGFGRWSHFLKDECKKLHLVDMVPMCIEACRNRFVDHSHVDYHVNDGLSLSMIPNGAIDFIFSYDSLVHVDIVTLLTYLAQLPGKLTPNGVAFIHHSNLAACNCDQDAAEKSCGRDKSVSGAAVIAACSRYGLNCFQQERIDWSYATNLTDAFSYICLSTSQRAKTECDIISNLGHNQQLRDCKKIGA